MGKPPAVIIIARHGSRLDQADKQWHLTSPTPYDPPLTYGGWTQARALGARIGGILRAREEEQEDSKNIAADGSASAQTPRKRKRKHNIIIHSSPFVRCVQTSIAIGAGIGQLKGRAPSHAKHHVMHSGSPHIHALENSPALSAIPEPAEDIPPVPSLPEPSSTSSKSSLANSPTSAPFKPHPPKKQKIAELRIDAFLGEWLSPDYFENITPPPGSVMMVAGAKAELLRPGEAMEGTNPGRTTHGNFPGGWSIDWSPTSSADESEEKPTGLANMAALGHSLTSRSRSSSQGSHSPNSYNSRRHTTRLNNNLHPCTLTSDLAYIAPTPTYAISSSDAIPVGYVAHARDACIDVSYQWDSMRAPQCWGSGGEYGEEWSSMHRRFRNGLSKMIEWYQEHGTAVNKAAELAADPDEEEDTDTVLILVTHGAGCNALLGALTNQPVLLDVGMASLTMAVRKERAAENRRGSEDVTTNSQSARRNSRRGSIDLGMAADYEMKYTASTEHLRAGSSSGGTGSALSPRMGPTSSGSYHPHPHSPYPHRRPATSVSGDSFTIGEGSGTYSTTAPSRPMVISAAPVASAPGSEGLRRSVSGHSGLRGVYTPVGAGSSPKLWGGLWRSGTSPGLGRFGASNEASESGGESDSLPNFGRGNTSLARASTSAKKRGTGAGLRGMDGEHDEPETADSRDEDDLSPDLKLQQSKPSLQQQQAIVNRNGNSKSTTSPSSTPGATTSSAPVKSPQSQSHPHTPTRTASHSQMSPATGLWGGVGGFMSGREREMPAKRRWTVVENAVR